MSKKLYLIEAKYAEVKATAEEMNRSSDYAFRTSYKYQKEREWYALGAAQRLLSIAGQDFPVHAAFGIPPKEPDFVTFDSRSNPWGNIEITEALEKDRKINDEYKQRARVTPPWPINPAHALVKYFPQLQKSITNKSTKRYASETVLLIWFNVPTWKVGFEEISSFSDDLVAGQATNPFVDLNRFKRVLVLSACFGYMVELHPKVQAVDKPLVNTTL
jgi:hypothetical protein